MKFSIKRLLGLLIIISWHAAIAQPADDAHSLVQQAVQFNKDGKYAEAIEKYNAALKIDSNNIYANYGIAYSLLASGKGKEGIPNLQKVIRSKTNLIAEADDLLGNIYDKDHESAKAIDAYNAAIKADAKYQHAYYNLGLVYFRDKICHRSNKTRS
jgi:tetratricopeptide (TPR) repeat protein